MKIRIIGCSGSGKTWLARRLSQQNGIPHYDLDTLQCDDRAQTYGVKMPVERRTALLAWTDTYQKKNLPQIRAILEQYPKKVYWILTRRDVRNCLIGSSPCAEGGKYAIIKHIGSKRRDGQPL